MKIFRQGKAELLHNAIEYVVRNAGCYTEAGMTVEVVLECVSGSDRLCLFLAPTPARFADDQCHRQNRSHPGRGFALDPLQEKASGCTPKFRCGLTDSGHGRIQQSVKVNVVKANQRQVSWYFDIHCAERFDDGDRAGIICGEQSIGTTV
jgi:hypothetical protein